MLLYFLGLLLALLLEYSRASFSNRKGVKSMSNRITIRLPGNEYPYNNCEILSGSPSNLEEVLVFKTVSKAGTERKVTINPNGTVIEEITKEADE